MITKLSKFNTYKFLFHLKYSLGMFDASNFVDIVEKKYRGRLIKINLGKLIIIPTPIGNMEDMSVNMYRKLF